MKYQRNYGIINNLREGVSDKILRSGIRDLQGYSKASRELLITSDLRNDKARPNLPTKRLRAGIFDEMSPHSNSRVLQNLRNEDKAQLMRILEYRLRSLEGEGDTFNHPVYGNISRKKYREGYGSLLSGLKSGEVDHLIYLGPNAGDGILSHELGHIGNNQEGGPISRWVSKNTKRGKIYHRTAQDLKTTLTEPAKPFKDILRDAAGSRLLVREEKNASRRAIRYMKKAGYRSDEVSRARDYMNKAYQTYDRKSRYLIKRDLYRKFQTPQRLKDVDKIMDDLKQ